MAKDKNDEVYARLLALSVALDRARNEIYETRGRLAHLDERCEHFRTECMRLEGENEKLASRNALLMAELEVGSDPVVEVTDLGDFAMCRSDDDTPVIEFRTGDCDCHGRVVQMRVRDESFTPVPADVLDAIVTWCSSARLWLEDHE